MSENVIKFPKTDDAKTVLETVLDEIEEVQSIVLVIHTKDGRTHLRWSDQRNLDFLWAARSLQLKADSIVREDL